MSAVLRHPWDHKGEGHHILAYAPTHIFVAHDIEQRFHETVRRLATRFVIRARECVLIGEQLEQEAMVYWIGATETANALGHSDLAQALGKLGVLEISKRGYQAILELSMA